MKNIFHFLKLIRISNLLLIALTMYIVRFGIVFPLLKVNNFKLQLTELQFFLLALSTVMIAASGYIINDYFDIKIDRINNPKKNIVGIYIKRRVAMGAHIVITILALLIAAYVAQSINFYKLVFIQVVAAGILWYYSVSFKKQAFLGNIIIAILTALVPFIAGFYDILLLHIRADKILLPFISGLNEYEISSAYLQYKMSLNNIFKWIVAYSSFAFLINFAREIVKDCEDMEGDKRYNSRTIPIIYGFATSNHIITFLFLFLVFILSYFGSIQFNAGNKYFLLYTALFIQTPLLWLSYKTIKAATKNDYSTISKFIKYVMLAGILYIPIFYFTILYA